MKLKGKIALVTGSLTGIGNVTADTLAKKGADIILNGLSAPDPETAKAVELIKKNGVRCHYVGCDVSDFDAVGKMFKEIKEVFGHLDILVNNAGITKDRTLKKMSPEEWNSVISVNLTSAFNVSHHALEIMPEGGRIINVSSIVAMGGNFGQTNYSASKAGLIGLTKSLSKEVARSKITVNAVAPGFIKTDMTKKIPIMVMEQILELIPLKSMGLPSDIGEAIAFFASDEARYITGQVLRIDGGLQM